MNQYKRIGIDTSKAVFTLHGIDQQDRPVLRINLRRAQLIPFFTKLPPTEIAMEACSGAHYWARELIALGHVVRLIPPQYVKPYVKRGKNDRNDAEAICEAAGRPGMHFVPAKSVTQQAPGKVGPLLTAIEQETTIPPEAKDMAILLGQQIANLDARIKEIEVKLIAAHKANAVSRCLATIPGVGPVTALTLAIEIDPAAFESGRHLAAWAGLTPTEHSTGGKQRMGGISRAGNERLRVLLVAGATSVINAAKRPGSKLMTEWLRALLLRKPRKVVAVALANKMARVAWALMTRGEVYRHAATTTGAAVA